MSMLDTHIPQLAAAESEFGAKAGLMRSLIGQAEQKAMESQAFHQGDSAVAFQAAHARFVEAANKINDLLHVAQLNLGDAAAQYMSADSTAAQSFAGA